MALLIRMPVQAEEAKGSFREHSEEGARHYRSGEFDAAVQSFTRAYEIRPAPILLFNIAQAHRQAGRVTEALSFYERFLLTAPEATLRSEAEHYITALRAPPVVVPAGPRSAAPSPAAAVLTMPPAPTPVASALPLVTRSGARPVYKRTWFWGGLAGIAAAAVAVSVAAVIVTAERNSEPASDLGRRIVEF